MEYTPKENTGNFFPNERKSKDSHPDYFGKVNVHGEIMEIAGWRSETKAGKPFINLRFSIPRAPKKDVDVPF